MWSIQWLLHNRYHWRFLKEGLVQQFASLLLPEAIQGPKNLLLHYLAEDVFYLGRRRLWLASFVRLYPLDHWSLRVRKRGWDAGGRGGGRRGVVWFPPLSKPFRLFVRHPLGFVINSNQRYYFAMVSFSECLWYRGSRLQWHPWEWQKSITVSKWPILHHCNQLNFTIDWDIR